MADGHGGHRTPSKPAPVSGPGALSRRTDGGPATQPQMIAPGNGYGERKDMEQIQSGAAMQGGGGSTPIPADLIPFNAPSQNPGEPVTAGADQGPGIGPQGAGIFSDQAQTLEQLRPMLRSLEFVASLPGSTPEMRSYVRLLRAKLNG